MAFVAGTGATVTENRIRSIARRDGCEPGERSTVDGMENESIIADASTDTTADEQVVDEQVVEEQLIEEISIDGMCGVY